MLILRMEQMKRRFFKNREELFLEVVKQDFKKYV